MLPVVIAGASLSTLLLLAWIALDLLHARIALADRACSACFVALGVTSVLTFRCLVVGEGASRGALPFFVFLGAPIGFGLGWLAWRMARERAAAG